MTEESLSTPRSKKKPPQRTLTTAEYKHERAKTVTEADVQHHILNYLALCGVVAFWIPNHGKMDPKTGRYNRVDAHHIKGVPDLAVILKGGRTAWFEVKRPDDGVVSPAQQHLLGLLVQMGHVAAVVRSVEEVQTILHSRGLL